MKQTGDPCIRAVSVKCSPHTLQMLFKHKSRSVWNKKQPVELWMEINAAESL